MSIQEAERLGLMRQIDKKKLTIKKASEELGLSLRQAKRIRKRYLEQGEGGLVSQKRGKKSNRKTPEELRSYIIELLKTKYLGFGATLASEKLEEREGIKISDETLRTWLIEENLWKAKKKIKTRAYQRRVRRSRFGEMLQGDGSLHDWFEGRSEKCTLVQFVDDATGATTVARFVPTETTEAYLMILKEHLEEYGRPLSLYVDKHAIFRVNKEEIKNGVFQDRLIKEMRLRGINTAEEGNAFLPEFLEAINLRFGKEAVNPENAHRELRVQDNLERIFLQRTTRKLSKELTFQHQGTLYLVQSKAPNRLRHATVEVLWQEGHAIEVEYKGSKLEYKKWLEVVYEQPKIIDCKELALSKDVSITRKKPGKHHPWR